MGLLSVVFALRARAGRVSMRCRGKYDVACAKKKNKSVSFVVFFDARCSIDLNLSEEFKIVLSARETIFYLLLLVKHVLRGVSIGRC